MGSVDEAKPNRLGQPALHGTGWGRNGVINGLSQLTRNGYCMGNLKEGSGVEQLIDAFLDHLMVERGLATNTRAAYRDDLAQFADFLRHRGIQHLNAVQRQQVTEYLLHRRKGGLSARSLSRHLAAIRMFCRFLFREKLLAADVTQTIDSPKLWRTLPHTLDYEEIGRLLAAPDTQTKLGLRDRAMLEFMYATGLRVSEVANIKLSDINFEAGFLRSVGKGNKERIVPVGTQAVDGIQR